MNIEGIVNNMVKNKKFKKQEVNEEILSSISSPNAWTKEDEDRWLRQPSSELRRRFPPMGKPRHITYVSN
jgi:hypothetical protein